MQELIPVFEKKTGLKVKATIGAGGTTRKQVASGEKFDVVVLEPPYPEVLASGHVRNESAIVLASVPLGLVVRKGAPKPDISSMDAFRKTLMNAKFVAYADPATGSATGEAFEAALKQAGMFDQMQSRIKRTDGGPAATALVAKGEAEIGVSFQSEATDPGVERVGPVPALFAPPSGIVVFMATAPQNTRDARALFDFLASPQAAAVYRAHNLTPGPRR